MVCRLVKQQKVRLRQHEFKQLNTRSFAAGEQFYLFFNFIAAKQECRKRVAYIFMRNCRIISVPNFAQNGCFRIKRSHCLFVIRFFNMRTKVITAFGRAHASRKNIQQRCFSAAVIAKQKHFLAFFYQHVNIAENELAVK